MNDDVTVTCCLFDSIYSAFGWTPPQFAHLPLLLNHDGSKVSKRQNHANIEYYRAQNILPQALINYVTRTGGGFPHVIGAKPKSYTMAELQERVCFGRVHLPAFTMLHSR